MNAETSIHDDPAGLPQDPFWVTTQFSGKELDRQHVFIEWLRGSEVLDWGIYQIQTGSYGHSRHIQSIHAVLSDGTGNGRSVFDFDQTDADLLHRTNQSPKEYSFAARLDHDRNREQNPLLDKLVHERRIRKLNDETGTAPWESPTGPVLHAASVPIEDFILPKDLDNPPPHSA